MGYVKPLRRKIGVMTLLITVVFAAGWIRCYSLNEKVYLNRPLWRLGIQSTRGICTPTFDSFESPSRRRKSLFGFHSRQNRLEDPFERELIAELQDWKWALFGCGYYGNLSSLGEPRSRGWFAGYPLIVIPLTLLSAWLLLSRPRAGKTSSTAPQRENSSSAAESA